MTQANSGIAGIGWLTFTVDVEYLSFWRKRIREYFNGELVDRFKGWHGYDRSYESVYGIQIGLTEFRTEKELRALADKRSPNEGKMTVQLTQSAMDALSPGSLWRLIADMGGTGAIASRIDIYYDDHDKIIHPKDIYADLINVNILAPRARQIKAWTGVNIKDVHQAYADGKEADINEGFTCYIGSFKSKKLVRIYDKLAESNGVLDCIRYEIQWRKTLAQEVFTKILSKVLDSCSEGSAVDGIFRPLIKGAINFLTVEDKRNIPANKGRDMVAVGWWTQLTEGIEACTIHVQHVPPSLARSVAWIKDQVAPSLALIREAYRRWNIDFPQWLSGTLARGERAWTESHHHKILEQAMRLAPAT